MAASAVNSSTERSGDAPVTVVLADDQALMRMGFRMVLDAEDGIEVIGEASDGASALAQARALRPDVILMDVRMPGMNGIDATAAITAQCPATKILILTTFDMDEYAFAEPADSCSRTLGRRNWRRPSARWPAARPSSPPA